MNRPVHFEIASSNPQKALEFYKNVFGWEASKFGEIDYWLITTGKDEEIGINGAITQKEGGEIPEEINGSELAINTTITMDVSDIDETIEKIKVNGGKVMTDKMEIPNIGINIYFLDPDGNLMGAMQSV